MITIKNKDLQPILFTLLQYNKDTGLEVAGLLTEELGMGVRRKLQKIRKSLLEKLKEFEVDVQELNNAFDKKVYFKLDQSKTISEYKASDPDSQEFKDWAAGIKELEAEFKKEADEFMEEEIKIDQEKAFASEIEKINSKVNYDWDLIDKISV